MSVDMNKIYNVVFDCSDECVCYNDMFMGVVKVLIDCICLGDFGMLFVVFGFIIILMVFSILNLVYFVLNNFVNMLFDCVIVGIILFGIVCVLLFGEIDFFVGLMSGLVFVMIGVFWVN